MSLQLPSRTQVYNMNGTVKCTTNGCPTWKEFYETRSNIKFKTCSKYGCTKDAQVGGHVRIANSDKKQYIIPLCRECNSLEHKDKPYHIVKTLAIRAVQ